MEAKHAGRTTATRRLQSNVAQLEREAAAREGVLAAQGDEVASLQSVAQEAQAQCNQYVMDLQVRGNYHSCSH